MLPLTRGLMDTLHAPRGITQQVELAPPPGPPPSSHATTALATERAMLGTMQDLRIDTVEKNRELDEQLSAVAARREAALLRLEGDIAPARAARLAGTRAALQAALTALEAELSGRVRAAFEARVAELAPPSEALEALGRREAECYAREVPRLFEAQCGAAVRTMQAEQQALQLDGATVRGWGGGAQMRALLQNKPHPSALS